MINYSLNPLITNKATRFQMDDLTDGFRPVQHELSIMVNHIKMGHSILAAVLKATREGLYKRANDYWDRSELIILDIDNSVLLPDKTKRKKLEEEGYLPLEKVVNNDFVKNYCLLIYTTASHTKEHNRFRMIFRLPHMMMNYQEYEQLLKAFILKFDADKQCSDPARLFYGNTEAEVFTFGKTLLPDHLKEVLSFAKNIDHEERAYKAANVNGQLTPEIAREMLSVIPAELEYIDWVRVISGIASKFDEETAVSLIEGWSPGKPGEVRYKIRKKLQKVTMGTVVYLARQFGWEPPKGFYTEEKQKHFKHTEIGNAERFVQEYVDVARYEHKSKMWYVWDGKRFKMAEMGEQYNLAVKLVRKMYADAAEIENESVRKALVDWARKSETKNRLSSMLSLAGNGTKLATTFDFFDTNAAVINLNNCVFDLDEFVGYDHSPEYACTRLIPIDYVEGAECPKWLKFLQEIFNPDETEEGQAMIDFIQRAVGYSLTGLQSEQCLFFAFGTGKNGKSIFFKTIQMLTGDYFQKAPTEMLLARKQDGIPNDVARLRAARFVVAAELPENKRFDEARIKDLTGGDPITARFLHGEWFEFNPTHKLWIYGNHKPMITGTDEGIWRRMKLIPFTVTIPEAKRRPQEAILAEFQAELPGILQWAMQGYYFWKNDGGLKTPKEVSDATELYRSEMDAIGVFIEQMCEKKPGARVKFTEVYDCYVKWAEKNGEYAIKSRSFNTRMKERGMVGNLGERNYYYWENLQLVEENAQQSVF